MNKRLFTLAEVKAVQQKAWALVTAPRGDRWKDTACFDSRTENGICYALRTEMIGGPSYDLVDTLFDLDPHGFDAFGRPGHWNDGLRLTAVAFIATIPARDLLEMLNA